MLPIQLISLLLFFQPQPSANFTDSSYVDFRIEPYQRTFHYGDEIKAVLVNQTWEDLYTVIPNGCGSKPIQKFLGGEWKTIDTRIKGVICTQVVRYAKLGSNNERTYVFPWHRIEQNGYKLSGRYRYCVSLTNASKEYSERICTDEFRIIK